MKSLLRPSLSRPLIITGNFRRSRTFATEPYSPSSGHSEPGWLVNCSFDEGCDVGLSFKQDAIYWHENGNLYVSYSGPQRSKVWMLEAAFCFGVSECGTC
jgi:hypothetical protein